MLAAFLGTQIMGISVRWILIGLAALAVTMTIAGGWAYVNNLERNLIQTRELLAREQLLRKSAEEGIERLTLQIAVANSEVEKLKEINEISSTEWLELSNEVFISPNLPTVKEIFDAKLDAVARGNVAANRMLRRASGAKTPGKN
jgi:hypothetical protein